MFYPADVTTEAAEVLALFRAKGRHIATVESCTGGLIAGALTEIPGSSDVLDGGLVTYANTAKMALVGVPEVMLKAHGAVSAPVAEAMARGALQALPTIWAAASVTGVAGPGGGSVEKPVGLVFMGAAWREPSGAIGAMSQRHHFQPKVLAAAQGAADPLRSAIRLDTVQGALSLLRQMAER
jgi:nicotinamide-nucleotide amidase